MILSNGQKVNMSGMFRCCVQSLTDKANNGDISDIKDGDSISCTYCRDILTFHNKTWKWIVEDNQKIKGNQK